MRIAVSGTHCSGKTTLIEEFLRAHPHFSHEPEAYTVLVEDYGEEFSAEPSADDFYRQLAFNVERLHSHAPGDDVVYERCPVDYLAYLLALQGVNSSNADPGLVQRALEMASDAIRNLDLIVFLPLDGSVGIEAPDPEDLKLRSAVDSRLAAIFGDEEFGLISSAGVPVVEARGSTAQRLQMLENAIASHLATGMGG